MGKYYLIKRYKEVNARREVIQADRKKPTYLHSCASDHIELAEHEAADELKSSRAQGEMGRPRLGGFTYPGGKNG